MLRDRVDESKKEGDRLRMLVANPAPNYGVLSLSFRRCNNVIKRCHKFNNINSPLVTITLNLLFILLQMYFIKGQIGVSAS